MPFTTSPNMFLIIPTVLQELGPAYATDVNASLSLIDSHNHSTGQGIPIPTSGMNINADLTFQSNNAYALRAVKFDNQIAALNQPSDLRMLYSRGGELYYVDNVGNQVKMTNLGAVNVTGSNGLGGDYGGGNPALLSYNNASVTYIFYQNPSGPAYANIDFLGLTTRGAWNLTSTAVASSPYTVTASDLVLLVDTSSARTINLPNAATSKRFLIIKDSLGTAGTNNITLDRTAGGNIDGVASNKVLKTNFGIWYLLSDGTNWFVLKDEPQDQTSITVFDGSTVAGTDTIPTAFASPTLSAAAFSDGTAVSRSTNTLTFPFIGKYRVDFILPELQKSGGNADVLTRVRNTTDSTTSAVGLVAQTGSSALGTLNASMFINVVDIAKNYEVQWCTSAGTTTVSAVTVNGETGPRWRISITKLKDHA